MNIENITIIAKVDGVVGLFPVHKFDRFTEAMALLQDLGEGEAIKAFPIDEEKFKEMTISEFVVGKEE